MELSEIYVNIEKPAGNRTKKVRGINNSESIYENVWNKKSEPNWTYTRSAQTGNDHTGGHSLGMMKSNIAKAALTSVDNK